MPVAAVSHDASTSRWKQRPAPPSSENQDSNAFSISPVTPPKMQPRSLLLRRRRYRRILPIIVISIVAFVCLKLWGRVTWRSKNDRKTWCLPNNDQIPYPTIQDKPPDGSTLPPLYEQYREYEDLLSKSHLANQTGDERYLSFENHVWGSGWGNVLQEMVFNSLLAWESGRSYVWDDYTWNRNGSDYGEFNGKIMPARIPLSTMMAGSFLGFDARDSSSAEMPPRPISKRVYDEICPSKVRKSIQQKQVQKYFDRQNTGKYEKIGQLSGKHTLNLWVSYLGSPELRNVKCLEIQKDTPQIFHIWLLGSSRMQNLWGPLIRSPVLTNWVWSPLIYRAFLKNLQLFVTGNFRERQDSQDSIGAFLDIVKDMLPHSLSPATMSVTSRDSYSHNQVPSSEQSDTQLLQSVGNLGNFKATDLSKVPKEILDSAVRLPILALHLRRGDFKDHCAHLAKYSSTYTGFNSFPDVAELDAFYVPMVLNHTDNSDSSGARRQDAFVIDSEQDKYDIYYRHCFPEVGQIVQRVRDVVHDFEMDLRRQMQEQAADQPWWAWGGVKKDYRRRHDYHSTHLTSSDSQTLESTLSGSNLDWKSDADSYTSYARRTFVPASSPQRVKRAPRLSSTKLSLANRILRKVYIMSNGEQTWLGDVAEALKEDALRSTIELGRREDGDWEFEFEWEDVGTSRDMNLGWEEKPVSQALDMYIGQRAEVFVGNGFSSMTSNIVMLRLKEGLNYTRTRFW